MILTLNNDEIMKLELLGVNENNLIHVMEVPYANSNIIIEFNPPNRIKVRIVNDDCYFFMIDESIVRGLIQGFKHYIKAIENKLKLLDPNVYVEYDSYGLHIYFDPEKRLHFYMKKDRNAIIHNGDIEWVGGNHEGFIKIIKDYQGLLKNCPPDSIRYNAHAQKFYLSVPLLLKEELEKITNCTYKSSTNFLDIFYDDILSFQLVPEYVQSYKLEIYVQNNYYTLVKEVDESNIDQVASTIYKVIESYEGANYKLAIIFNQEIDPYSIKINDKIYENIIRMVQYDEDIKKFELDEKGAKKLLEYTKNPEAAYKKMLDTLKDGKNLGCSIDMFIALQEPKVKKLIDPNVNIINEHGYKMVERDIKEEEKGYYGEFVHTFSRYHNLELLKYLDKFKKIDGEVCFTPFEAGERIFIGENPHNFIGIIMEGFCIAKFDADVYSYIDKLGRRVKGDQREESLSEVWAIPNELDFIGIITNDVKIYKKYKNQLNIIFLHSFPENRTVKKIPKMSEPPVPAKVKNIKGFE